MRKDRKQRMIRHLYSALLSIVLIAAATAVGTLFRAAGFPETNIVIIYMLAVLLCARFTTGFVYGLAVSVIATAAFNFFFTAPYHSLQVYDPDYLVTFAVMTTVSLLTSALTSRVKKSVLEIALREKETQALYVLTNRLSETESTEEIARVTVESIRDVFQTRAELIWFDDSGISETALTQRLEDTDGDCLTDGENCIWPINGRESRLGLLRIPAEAGQQLGKNQKKLLWSMLECAALAVDQFRAAQERLRYREESEHERYRGNLLRAISHDLRTPLTSISGNASNLLANEESFDKATRHQIYRDIYNDSLWLINLVENLLSVTRITKGEIQLHLTAELMDEVVAEALRHVGRQSAEHTIRVISSDDLILAKIDAKLMVQVVINIVDNAIKYTPPGSTITISTEKRQDKVVVKIADDGPGVPDEAKPRIFDMFYTGAGKIADSRRSLGLGLALCKSIIDAHGGTLSVSDNKPHGAVFTFTLQAEEVDLHE